VQEGQVAKVRIFGPERRAAMVTLKETAPGGERMTKVRARGLTGGLRGLCWF